MGNCFKQKSDRAYKYQDNEDEKYGVNLQTKKSNSKSIIKIKQNPKTSKLEGVPRKWVDDGYCDPGIVELDQVVDVNLPLEQTNLIDVPDAIASYLGEDVISIQGSLGTASSIENKTNFQMKLDSKSPYGISNIPEIWVQKLKLSNIEQDQVSGNSQIILDLIKSQSNPFGQQKVAIRQLISDEDFKNTVREVEIIYENPGHQFNIIQQIGKGAACRVYQAQKKESPGKKYAIRIMRNKKPEDLIKIQEQIVLMKFCSCSNTLEYFETYYFKQAIYMVVQFLNAGSLTSLITRKTSFPQHFIAYIMRQIIKGLQFLHRKKLIHRDLKSDNILMSAQGELKIADFGFAAQLTKQREMRNSIVGTPAWMAPQLIRKQSYDEKVDIWSIGVILYQLCCKQPPYLRQPPLKAMYLIVSRQPPSLPTSYSENLRNFYEKCCRKQPSARSSCRQLLSHPLFGGLKNNQSIKRDFSQFIKKSK